MQRNIILMFMKDNEREQKDAQSYVLSLVAKKEYTRHQLREKVLKRHDTLDVEALEEILNDSESQGFFSDMRFAGIYVRQSIGKGGGPLKIKQKLWEKGVDKDVASQAIEEEYDTDLQRETALEVLRRKISPKASKDKLMRYLMGKGFSSQIVYSVADELIKNK